MMGLCCDDESVGLSPHRADQYCVGIMLDILHRKHAKARGGEGRWAGRVSERVGVWVPMVVVARAHHLPPL
jgi:hypothetical protein